MAKQGFNFDDFKTLKDNILFVQKDFDNFLRKFLLKEALVVLGRTKKLTPWDTGLLRSRWELSKVLRDGDSLYIVLFNPIEYASFVEDGHMQYRRFVPGYFKGKKFVYVKGGKTGMMLKTKWINGFHMARIPITKLELQLPAKYKLAFKDYARRKGLE